MAIAETLEKKIYKRLPLNEDGSLIKNKWGIKSPRNLIIVKYPKSGSTMSLCDVPKILIADSEDGTSQFLPDNRVLLIDESLSDKFVPTSRYGAIPQTIFDLVDELKKANGMVEYWALYNKMQNERNEKEKENHYKALIELINEMPFPILAVDTITSILKLSNSAALYEYNSNVKEASRKLDIKRTDEYGGVTFIRRKFNEIKKFIEQNSAPFIQYHGHVSTRKKVLKKTEEDISAVDIALDGLISTIFTSEAEAVCTFWRDDKGCYLDFTKKEETDLGSRNLHLSNAKIKIADIATDEDLRAGIRPKTYWNLVYPEVQF